MEVSGDDNHEICIEWVDYFSNLGRYIRELAVDRCHQTLKDRAGRENIRDGDYEP